MRFINKISNSKKVFIIFFTLVLLLNTFFINRLNASAFKIYDMEINEEFDLKFHKTKVFEKAFKTAFVQLISMVVSQEDKKKIEKTKISTIKSLIDSFEVSDEKFVQDKYIARFNVSFNKKNTLKFFEKENIFPSIPKKIDILLIPILINVNEGKLMIFDENPIYKNWNEISENFHLLNYILPNEDIEDRNFLKKNLEFLEEYDFNEIINKYEMSNYIVNIIYQDNETLKIFSRVKLNNDLKIVNKTFEDINLHKKDSLEKLIVNLKNTYEDSWKKLNVINTSIKLPFTVILSSKENEKIKLFDDALDNLDLVSSYNIISFNSNEVTYKIIYNGSPKKFLSEIKNKKFDIEKKDQNWRIK